MATEPKDLLILDLIIKILGPFLAGVLLFQIKRMIRRWDRWQHSVDERFDSLDERVNAFVEAVAKALNDCPQGKRESDRAGRIEHDVREVRDTLNKILLKLMPGARPPDSHL
jgi:hypothetical protein